MKTENVFSKSRSRRSTHKNLIFGSIAFVDFCVSPSFIHGNQVFPRLLHMSSANVNMGSTGWTYISQIKEEGEATIPINIVMKALARSFPLFAVGRTGEA